MEKLAKIIDEDRGLVIFIEQTQDEDSCLRSGFKPMDIVRGHDGMWYVADKAPKAPETKNIRVFSTFEIWKIAREIEITLDTGEKVAAWDMFEDLLSSMKLLTGWLHLKELSEDNELFIQYLPLVSEALGESLVSNILNASVIATRTVKVSG